MVKESVSKIGRPIKGMLPFSSRRMCSRGDLQLKM